MRHDEADSVQRLVTKMSPRSTSLIVTCRATVHVCETRVTVVVEGNSIFPFCSPPLFLNQEYKDANLTEYPTKPEELLNFIFYEAKRDFPCSFEK